MLPPAIANLAETLARGERPGPRRVLPGKARLGQEGEFEIDALLGYVAGVPTYSLMAERAIARTLHGALPGVGRYPSRLAASASQRWRSDFTLTYARMQAAKGDVVGTVGQSA